jgi:hypothetical protein
VNCVVVFRLAQPVDNLWEALFASTAKPGQVSILMGSFWIQYISHYSLRERCSSMWKPRVIGVSSLRGKIILTFHNHFECTLYLLQLITAHGESFFLGGTRSPNQCTWLRILRCYITFLVINIAEILLTLH